ncbi:hypothetical protein PQR62_15075 [Herbaspirillum lusitanum]|uniref:Uncharacterized protein n=1 Tax=Herbaspirillum lusitanum TaxID=213312 RepID=A0ABW9AB25_9BURK
MNHAFILTSPWRRADFPHRLNRCQEHFHPAVFAAIFAAIPDAIPDAISVSVSMSTYSTHR